MTELLVGSGFGRVVALRGGPEVLAEARGRVPFWWRASDAEPERVFDLVSAEAIPLIVRNIESWVAEHARGAVFVHAAAVAVDGRAVLVAGASFSGKTTLCRELLRQGADYLSDEYAVLDADGRVSAYPRDLHVREENLERTYVTPAALGAGTQAGSVPVALAVLLDYNEHAGWSVEPLPPIDAVMRLLANVVCGRVQPEASLHAVVNALADARCLAGTRGQAAEAARLILEEAITG